MYISMTHVICFMTRVMTGLYSPIFFAPNLSLLYPSGHPSSRGMTNGRRRVHIQKRGEKS
jgi:hypothetical protein